MTLIPVNIYDLGLVYKLEIDDQAIVYITMTLKRQIARLGGYAWCVYNEVKQVEGVKDVKVEFSL